MISVLENEEVTPRRDFRKEFLGRRIRVKIFFGCPGCGKGTVGKAVYATVKDEVPMDVREMSAELAKDAVIKTQYMDKGILVPFTETIRGFEAILDDFLGKAVDGQYLILDGFPRKRDQAKYFLNLGIPFQSFEFATSQAEATLQIMVRAILGGKFRPEDHDLRLIAERQRTFITDTLPAIKLCRAANPGGSEIVRRNDLLERVIATLRGFGFSKHHFKHFATRVLGNTNHPARVFIEETKAKRNRIIKEHNLLDKVKGLPAELVC